MKKKMIVFSAVCMLVLAAAVMTGCGPKLEEPVFVKSLISAEDMDVDTQYITEETWDKKVKNLEIPDAPPDISIDIYDQQYEEEGGYRLHTISWGVGTTKLNEDSGMAVPLEFDHLEITWDDGSTSTADVGHVKICSLKENGFSAMSEESHHTQFIEQYVSTAFQAKRSMDITGIDLPFEQELSQVLSSVEINDIPYDEIDPQDPIHLEKGESCKVGYLIDEKKKSEYGTVFVEAQLIGVDYQGKKQAGTFRIIDRRGIGGELEAYLKRVKGQ